ncbi:hypothetical protein J1614_009003 [Plenodomus biglobosus]|nr:hypothetical protein J1614_009003 [Plenodomus biglobosus]
MLDLKGALGILQGGQCWIVLTRFWAMWMEVYVWNMAGDYEILGLAACDFCLQSSVLLMSLGCLYFTFDALSRLYYSSHQGSWSLLIWYDVNQSFFYIGESRKLKPGKHIHEMTMDEDSASRYAEITWGAVLRNDVTDQPEILTTIEKKVEKKHQT